MSTQTALSVIERASVALGSSALDIHLKDLVKKNADIAGQIEAAVRGKSEIIEEELLVGPSEGDDVD